jgi:hypothetical protein
MARTRRPKALGGGRRAKVGVAYPVRLQRHGVRKPHSASTGLRKRRSLGKGFHAAQRIGAGHPKPPKIGAMLTHTHIGIPARTPHGLGGARAGHLTALAHRGRKPVLDRHILRG